MKTLICFASVRHGNTKKIAEAMAEAIGAELVPTKDVKTKNIEAYDLIGFGSGIYFSQHNKSLLAAVDALRNVSGKKAFVFSTAGFPAGKFMFHRALRKRLAKKGFVIAGEFSCKGLDTYKILGSFGSMNKGHPDYRDLERAFMFCKRDGRTQSIEGCLLSCYRDFPRPFLGYSFYTILSF
jgi:flavodoxin